MQSSISIFVFCLLASGAHGAITNDYNCTMNVAGAFKYSAGAVNCQDALAPASCQLLFKLASGVTTWPDVEKDTDRPLACYTALTSTPFTFDETLKDMAITNCPKTCGYCCLTPSYKCTNVQFPRIKCETITASQCNSVAWRTVIAQDCPNSCGFCNEGGCVDAVTNCATDLSICQNIGMQDFVNQYCQKTCARCPSTTASSVTTAGSGGGSCTSYNTDSSSACASWAANGFCTNNFYTYDQRKARCATTCRLC